MKERPILFSGPMVRAILEGRKTVTRRPVKGSQIPKERHDEPDPAFRWSAVGQHDPRWGFLVTGATEAECAQELARAGRCPHGKPGDRLWVRESWWQAGENIMTHPEDDEGVWSGSNRVHYSADGLPPNEPNRYYPEGLRNGRFSAANPDRIWRHRPSIHMPRWASRILLEITGVRVERLQDISEEQAIAEGCFFTNYGRRCGHGGKGWQEVGDCPAPEAHHPQNNGWMWDKTTSSDQCLGSARWAFGNLWEKTGGDWDANPWVWVVEFKRVTP